MKCQHCKTENLSISKTCARCGRPLERSATEKRDLPKPRTIYQAKKPQVMDVRPVGPRENITTDDVASKIKSDYRRSSMEPSIKMLDGIQMLHASLRTKEVDLKGLMEKAANHIHQQFRIRWVSIGTKSRADDKFRYDVLVGFKEGPAEARKKQSFDLEDFFEDKKYRGRMISDYTKLFLEEDRPYTEGAEVTFNRPILINSKRREIDDALEADYLDVHIYGVNKELNGWIEMSGTIMGKLPNASTIKAIETIADIIGQAILRSQSHRFGK